MFKDLSLIKWIVGLLIVAVSAGASYGLVVARVTTVEDAVVDIEERIQGLSRNLVGLENKSRDEGWEDYSAWHYQLQVNEVILEALNIPKTLRPVPPEYLRERP